MQATTRRPMVAGNWKMNGDTSLIKTMQSTLAQADLSNMDWVICPPMPLLGLFDKSTKLGSQNVSQFDSGAHTGETSTSILKEVGCQYVIIGHSERRQDNHESDQLIAEKVKKTLDAGLTPIFCFGEPESVRDDGSLFEYLSAQLDAVLEVIGISAFADLVMAYEPIWAIGTGKTASPEQAQEVHAFVRDYLAKQDANVAQQQVILYGGSVKGSNADELFSQPDVDGGLIGGASLKPDDFLSICLAANKLG